jgi:hypothetical protein
MTASSALVVAALITLVGAAAIGIAAALASMVLGFAAILFTWLGAGLLFVGQHSYAGA